MDPTDKKSVVSRSTDGTEHVHLVMLNGFILDDGNSAYQYIKKHLLVRF